MKYGFIGISLLLLLFLLGPQVKVDRSIKSLSLPDKLDDYIRYKEKQVEGIRPNTEKTIIWADPNNRSSTALSIIYLHGFSATRQEVAPLCENLAAALGANLFYTRLAGHGRSGVAMKEATVNAMINDAYEALQVGMKLGRQVIVIASSTGASLATLIARLDKQHSILALIMMSPNFGLKRRESELLLMPWASVMVNLVEGPVYRFEPQNDLQARYWTTQYPSSALIQMMGLVKLIRDEPLELIQQPVLILYSPGDQVVSVEDIQETYKRFGSANKQIYAIDNSGDNQKHTLAGDALSPGTTTLVFNKIMGFINSIESKGPEKD